MGRKRFKRWNSCLMWFAASLGAFCLTISCIGASDEGEATASTFSQGKVHGCTSSASSEDFITDSKLMLVSTLDGKLTALNVNDESGKLLWSVAADSRPLLSSSISKLEIMHEGVPTRYIPSLDGGLYRYDGESIEAVPMTAETLLSSSFKLGDNTNTVMIGGKDMTSYGLNPKTGQVRYACGVKGCHMFGEEITKQEDIMVVSRQTQTVRAVDSRTGMEKWNFSVGEHEVSFLKGQRNELPGNQENSEDEASDVTCVVEDESDSSSDSSVSMEVFSNSIKIVVPEGMVVGVNPENMQAVTWKYKFNSPISNAWLLYKGKLQQIDMFGGANIPAISSFEPEEQPLHPPLLYVGMHQSQFYVQPASQMQDRVSQAAEMYGHQNNPSIYLANIPSVAWKPYLNTAQWRTPIMNNRQQITSEPHEGPSKKTGTNKGQSESDHCEEGDNALTIWHENYPFDNGFYLYPDFTIHVPVPNPDDEGFPEGNQSSDVHQPSMLDDFLPITLWNWWKEVVAISVLTSVVVHMILTRVQKVHHDICNDSTINQSSSVDSLSQKLEEIESNPPCPQNSEDFRTEYTSRYASDFEHIQILGKGGFGIVFETKNKVDDCHYAIKRIALPNSDGAKEKVMREVKALAKLDHVGIVRYFHAWIESPPPGWQEERDKEIEQSECITSVTQFGTPTHSPYGYSSKSSPGSKRKEILGTSPKLNNNSPKKPSPMDFLQNPFGGNNFEISVTELKKGSSEEFSVQGQSNSMWDDNEDDESGSFSCGMGTPKMTSFLVDDSVDVEFKLSDSERSNDKNSNNNCTKSIPFSHHDNSVSINEQDEHNINIDDTDSSFQIVFEDSGCADKSSKGSTNEDVCIGIQSSKSADLLGSHGTGSNSNSANKNSRSRTHSRSLSRDLAKLTYEKEVKCDNKNNKMDDVMSKTSSPTPMLFLYIQMQLCKRESLKDWLSSNTLNRDRHMVLDIFDQIACAIEYVHDCGLMHRDLKPSNIFFSLDGVIKMGDFGLVTALPEEQNEFYGDGNPYKKHTAQVGTQLYMSPEQTSGKVYSHKVDIFSLGVISFELLYPFATQMERVNTLVRVKQQIFPERFCREMHNECEFARWLLSPCPEDRPTAKEILDSDLLKEFEGRRMPRRFRTRTVSQNSH